ncbi:hypothetical protein C8Q80DRAFT_1347214 [Daedaleopsis nitida]|nr:hypothetical protein C8Q80DRAFT_1347214 [Daedaleopsis nitida]
MSVDSHSAYCDLALAKSGPGDTDVAAFKAPPQAGAHVTDIVAALCRIYVSQQSCLFISTPFPSFESSFRIPQPYPPSLLHSMPIWDKIAAAATAQEPSPPAPTITARRSNKRPRTDTTLSDGGNDSLADTPQSTHLNANLPTGAKHVAREKHLKPEQGRDLQEFATYSMHAQNIIIMAHIFGNGNKLNGLIPPPAAFEVSESLTTNLTSYAHGIILSSKISNYKGTVALNHLLESIKILRFDLPPGIEHDMTNWEKLVKGMKPREPYKCQGLYALTNAILKNTAYKITVPLMARVVLFLTCSLQRQVFTEDLGDDFWDTVDNAVKRRQLQAWHDSDTLVLNVPTSSPSIFKMLLDNDRNQYGPRNEAIPDIDNVVDELQQKVDNAIEEATRRVAQAPLRMRTQRTTGTVTIPWSSAWNPMKMAPVKLGHQVRLAMTNA